MTVRRTAAVAAAAAFVAAGCAGQEPGAFSPRSSDARAVNDVFWLMVALGGLVFALVMVLFVMASRSRTDDRDDAAARATRSERLIVGGGVVMPIVILIPLTVVMLAVGQRVSPTRDAALEIAVTGHQFWWEVEYPDGTVTANEIHIPADRPVRFVLRTADVIHSFWVPQLAGKIDMIPGETTELVIEADEPGTYLGQCAEFCGVQHARMRLLVVVEPFDEFEAWLGRRVG
jgi:cytochrome c oxidase subunit II